VTEPLQISHRRALFQSFSCVIHEKRVKLTTKNTKDTKKFAAAKMRRRCAIFPVMRRFSQWLLVAMLAATACGQKPAEPSDFAAERQRMVQQQLMARGINDARVLAAMAKVPREEFVPPESRAASYEDGPMPIGHGQTISQPYIVAFMTEQLRPKPSDHVLEIGTGSGYQAAILAGLVKDVYTIEIIEALAKDAEATLQRLGYKNVHAKVGDGYRGWPEHAPFDAITVTCAPDHVPQPLIDQLKEGGRMIIPVGGFGNQELYLLEKKSGQLQRRAVLPVRFVPMAGEAVKRK
jgi:protein-L-isoaspartate(D-aspartate) O-methyltransferase